MIAANYLTCHILVLVDSFELLSMQWIVMILRIIEVAHSNDQLVIAISVDVSYGGCRQDVSVKVDVLRVKGVSSLWGDADR